MDKLLLFFVVPVLTLNGYTFQRQDKSDLGKSKPTTQATTDGPTDVSYKLLRVYNGTSLGMFNLWNLTNISCGNENYFYRSDLIDNLQPNSSCPTYLFLTFYRYNGDEKYLKFSFTSSNLQSVLQGDTTWVYPLFSTAHYPLIDDHFEFKLTDVTGNTMYAGIMQPFQNNGSTFFHSASGIDITNDVPITSEYVSVELSGLFQDFCNITRTFPAEVSSCLEPPTLTVAAEATVVYGSNIQLNCTINSTIPVSKVYWDITTQGGYQLIEMSPADFIVFDIVNADFTNEGSYECYVENVLGIDSASQTLLSVYGAVPDVTTSTDSITLKTSDTVTLSCFVTAVPPATSFYWTKREAGVDSVISTSDPRFSFGPLPSPYLTITNLQTSDNGSYVCHAQNLVGVNESSEVILMVNEASTTDLTTSSTIEQTTSDSTTTEHASSTTQTDSTPSSTSTTPTPGVVSTASSGTNTSGLCPCSCDYKARVDYWANHNVTNMTYNEIVEWLQPKIKELEKVLTIDKTNISAILRSKISAKDDRPSAKGLGAVGIVILSVVVMLIVLSDVTSLPRHAVLFKHNWSRCYKKD